MGVFNLFGKSGKAAPVKEKNRHISTATEDYHGVALDKSLEKNIDKLGGIFRDCEDYVMRPFKVGEQVKACLIFIDGMIKIDAVDSFIIKPLLLESRMAGIQINDNKNVLKFAKDSIITTTNIKESGELEEVLFAVLAGDIVILFEGSELSLIIDVKGWEHRQVEQPTSEAAVRGPKDSFTENIRINTALIRRRIRDTSLKAKSYHIGRRSKTHIVVMYVENIVERALVDEVYKRLDGIDVDNVVGSGFMEQLLEDCWFSPFPQFQSTERPDRAAAALLEGKVCIITDNTPYISMLPATMNDLLTAPDDYYERWMISSLIRIVRLIGAVVATVLPALYIAMATYHPEMIPTALAISIAAGREGIPFPAFVEAVLMEGAFELMREAGIRLPGSLGQTVGVVGAVVIGQAAVAAGVASPAMVVVVSLTGIANFAVPSFDVALSYRLLRFGLMAFSAVLGLYGLILGLLLVLSHLCILKSFGIPYMAPWIPLKPGDLKDTIIRAPWLSMHLRPSFMHLQDNKRFNLDKTEEILSRRKSGK